jgi:hypothetical protein
LKEGDTEVGGLELMYLSDLITIVEKQEELRRQLGYQSRSKAKDALGGLNELRTRVMHLVKFLIKNREDDLTSLQDRIGRIEKVLGLLEKERREYPAE